MNLNVILLTAFVAATASAQERAVPVEQEPEHKTVFKNEYVQAFHVTLAPGKSTGMHVHAHDDAVVRLSKATVTSDSPGKPTGDPEFVVPGLVSARACEKEPLTHRVHNVGTTPFEVLRDAPPRLEKTNTRAWLFQPFSASEARCPA